MEYLRSAKEYIFDVLVGNFFKRFRPGNVFVLLRKKITTGNYYESGVGGPGGFEQAAAARLDAAGFGGVGEEEFPVSTNLSGDLIAPAAAERYKSAREAERAVLESERRRVLEQRAQQRDDGAIPKGASVEKLGEWISMVESELGDIARRFFFLCGGGFGYRKYFGERGSRRRRGKVNERTRKWGSNDQLRKVKKGNN